VIDVSPNTVTATVSVGDFPFGVAITPDGDFAYVTNVGSNTVSVIDIATNTVTATVGVFSPGSVAITPAGDFAYVTTGFVSPGRVAVIDVGTNTVTATVSVGVGATGVAITPAGDFAYVTDRISGNVSVIDIATNTVTTTVDVGDDPGGVAITPAISEPCTPEDLSDAIAALGPDGDGTLNEGQANALQRKVDQVRKLLDKGKTQAAAEILADFIQQVEELEAAGVLSAGQAADLVGCAENIG
jgi:YVTN family beta-propeller protein